MKDTTDRISTILVADDEPNVRDVIGMMLSGEGYHLIFAENGAEAVDKAHEIVPDLILLDVMMPKMDGYEVCRRLRGEPILAQVPIIMITALGDTASKIRGINSGADDFISKPFDLAELTAKIKNIIRLNRFRQIITEKENLKRAHVDLQEAYNATLEGWARALELRDAETQGHCLRVTDQTMSLARAMGISDDNLDHVHRGALLHDIGKMGIPDAILLKPGPLTEEEWVVMKKHPEYAYRLLSPIEYLRSALDIPYCHHEKWDGTGYPRGLKEEGIPLAARVFAVVDVFDALSTDRPYRPAFSTDWTIVYLREKAGSHFDPAVVEAFLTITGRGDS
ncbi:MAG: response regulator [Deltaproteobacteria bacterium]|nr:response regulator [Candidatus Zymogenaceae bacterium]